MTTREKSGNATQENENKTQRDPNEKHGKERKNKERGEEEKAKPWEDRTRQRGGPHWEARLVCFGLFFKASLEKKYAREEYVIYTQNTTHKSGEVVDSF